MIVRMVSLFVDFWWLVGISLRMGVVEAKEGTVMCVCVCVSWPLTSGQASGGLAYHSCSSVI